MSRTVFCCKLKQESEGMDKAPFPGALGEKIFNHVSKEGWSLWLAHQTMLINEYRLNLIEANARQFLKDEMQKYFFGEGSAKPSGFSEKN